MTAIVVAGLYLLNLAGPSFCQAASAVSTSATPPEAPAETATPVTAPATSAPAEVKAGGTSAPSAANPVVEMPAIRMPLLIFPLDSSDVEGKGDVLGNIVAKAMKDGTLRSVAYTGTVFSKKHPVIKRALDENTLKEAEVLGPFGIEKDQIEKAVKIARIMGMPRLMVGAVTDFQFNNEKREGTITITAEIIDRDTGRIEGKTMVATGKSAASMVTGTQEQYALSAASDATMQVMSQFPGVGASVEVTQPGTGNPPDNKTQTQTPAKKKKKNGGLIAALLILVGAVIAGGGGGGGGSSTGLDQPPAPPF